MTWICHVKRENWHQEALWLPHIYLDLWTHKHTQHTQTHTHTCTHIDTQTYTYIHTYTFFKRRNFLCSSLHWRRCVNTMAHTCGGGTHVAVAHVAVAHMAVRRQAARSWFSLSTLWVSGIELGLSGLVPFVHCAILTSPKLLFLTRRVCCEGGWIWQQRRGFGVTAREAPR